MNTSDKNVAVILLKAAAQGDAELLRQLAQGGIIINEARDEEGQGSLHLSCCHGHVQATSTLISKGADLNMRTSSGTTPLMAAALHGKTMCAELLLDHRALLDAQDGRGNSAILLASLAGHADIVRLLTERGANTRLKNEEGISCANLAPSREPSESIHAKSGRPYESTRSTADGKGEASDAAAALSKRGSEQHVSRYYVPKQIVRTDEQWKKALSRTEYAVLRGKATDRPFTGQYDKFYPRSGHFVCRACHNPLYSAQAKYDAGCGWPSFDKCYQGGVRTYTDTSHGITRSEITCAACDGHLGHVFAGSARSTTGERHCVNSTSVRYEKGRPQMALHEDVLIHHSQNAISGKQDNIAWSLHYLAEHYPKTLTKAYGPDAFLHAVDRASNRDILTVLPHSDKTLLHQLALNPRVTGQEAQRLWRCLLTHPAFAYGDREVVVAFLNRRHRGDTALYLSAVFGKTPAVRALAVAGADVNIGDPLSRAIEMRRIETAAALLELGADTKKLYARDKWGHAAIDFVCGRFRTILLQHNQILFEMHSIVSLKHQLFTIGALIDIVMQYHTDQPFHSQWELVQRELVEQELSKKAEEAKQQLQAKQVDDAHNCGVCVLM